MLGWQGAGKILADNLGACLQHSPTQERGKRPDTHHHLPLKFFSLRTTNKGEERPLYGLKGHVSFF